MCNLSDYFQPIHELEKEARIFSNHKDLHSWFYHETGSTIVDKIPEDHMTQQELDGVYYYLQATADQLLFRLESYEMFELCKLVAQQFKTLKDEYESIASNVLKLK